MHTVAYRSLQEQVEEQVACSGLRTAGVSVRMSVSLKGL